MGSCQSRHEIRLKRECLGAGWFGRTSISTAGETFKAFAPRPQPPEPPVVLDGALERLHGEALLALLHGASARRSAGWLTKAENSGCKVQTAWLKNESLTS